MADSRRSKLVAALIYKDEGLYFVREKGNGAFTLPMFPCSGASKKGRLVKGLRNEYGIEGYLIRRLPQIVAYDYKGFLVDSYLVEVDLSHLNPAYEFVAITEDDVRMKDVDPVSAMVAKRGFIFMPFYQQRMRTVPFFEADQEKVYWEIACLRYFKGKKVPHAEVREFEGLVDSASSLRRINEAFAMICNRYGANPNEYIMYLDYREKRREALK